MGEKGDEEQLLAFLNAVLKRTGKGEFASIEIIENKVFLAEIIGDKTSILDVRAVMGDGTKANVEVQLRNFGNMDKRILFYWSLGYTKGIKAGQDYGELPDVIAINIIDFEFVPVNDFHTSFHLWEDFHKECMLTDALEIHFIDMVKFRRLKEKDIVNDPLHRWLTFFDKNTNNKTLEEVINMDTAIQKAQDRISFVRSSEEELRVYQMREMAMMDYTSGMNFARREGLAKGISQVARSMKKASIPLSQITLCTGLSEDEVNRL
jgi:predicted transposase/invertase (TIGR01784 family)